MNIGEIAFIIQDGNVYDFLIEEIKEDKDGKRYNGIKTIPIGIFSSNKERLFNIKNIYVSAGEAKEVVDKYNSLKALEKEMNFSNIELECVNERPYYYASIKR